MEHIGFVGVGRMGANMARRLHDQGHRITAVQDRDPPVAQALALELGCEAAATPARVAEVSQVIVTVVPDDPAMRAIYAEDIPSSLLAFAKTGCSSIAPPSRRPCMSRSKKLLNSKVAHASKPAWPAASLRRAKARSI